MPPRGRCRAACTAALTVVLDALGQKAGPEDTRTAVQRRHDALEEACQRPISARMLIVIHRWGWKITRHPDGTTTATSPDGRILHSHSPPRQPA